MTKNLGTMLVFCAPSGAGKSTITRNLLENDSKIKLSVSVTTRAKRPGEKDGVHYHFIDKEKFEELKNNDQLFEYAHVFDNYYGSPKIEIEKMLQEGYDVLFDIDWQGAKQIKEKSKNNAVFIYIAPPSYEELYTRLINRKQDDEQTIKSRMEKAKSELSHYKEFDYIIVNDNLDQAIKEVKIIIKAQRLKIDNNLHATKIATDFLNS